MFIGLLFKPTVAFCQIINLGRVEEHDLGLSPVFFHKAEDLDKSPFHPLDVVEKRKICFRDQRGKISVSRQKKQKVPASIQAVAQESYSV